jgi:hypothetical protein
MTTGPPRAIRCVYCGREEPLSATGVAAMTEHAVRCPGDLLAAAARQNALLRECLGEVLAWLGRPRLERSSEEMVGRTIEAVLARVEGG